jgi:hypothetical protein
LFAVGVTNYRNPYLDIVQLHQDENRSRHIKNQTNQRMSSSGQSYTSSSASSDVTPLLGNSNTNSDSGGNFYFLQSSAGGASHGSNRSAVSNEVVEKLPYGATEDEFASRPIVVSDNFRAFQK